jgi:adenylate cyclase
MRDKRWLKLLFPKHRPLRWILPVFIFMLILLLQAALPAWSDFIEGATIDLRFWLRGPQAPQKPIVLVVADEDSFQMLADLRGENIRAWPRARWADVLEIISKDNPRVIGVDIAFDTPGWDENGDQVLAAALANAPDTVLAAHFKQDESPLGVLRSFRPPQESLSKAAVAVGVANLAADVDGVYRRATLIWPWSDSQLPSFALAAATLYNGAPVNVPRADLDKGLNLGINFRGPEGTFRTLPLYRVLDGSLHPGTFDDAIVIIGYTTIIEQDRHPAPFATQSKLPGVEIQANAIDTLLAGNWLRHPPRWGNLLIVALAGIFALVLTSLPRANLGLGLFTIALLLYVAAGQAAFATADFVLPLAAPLASALLTGGASTAERMIFAERDKRLLRQRFSGLMSPERLQALLDNWQTLLDSKRPEREASVLFCDIRGFTAATEALMREGRSPEMVRFLTAYLDEMEQAVFAEGGVIYRTFGDGLLVLFGLPEPLPNHACSAARAAMRMALAFERLTPLWPLCDEAPFEMGLGANCGQMTDAIIGRGRRFDYTVLGDAVNAAARIESHCKVAMQIPRPPGKWPVPDGMTILLGFDLYERVSDLVIVDEQIPPFEARGKSEPLRVARLLGLAESEVL